MTEEQAATGRATRRAVLVGGALLPLAACTGGDPQPPRPAPVDPDVALREAAVARERALLAAYDAALLAAPGQAALAVVRAEHATHLGALGVPDPAPPPATTGTAPPPGSPAAPAPAAPTAAAPAPAALAQLERDASAAHARDVPAASRALAALLAQLAAAEAAHPVALA